jgi:hypothetical protein
MNKNELNKILEQFTIIQYKVDQFQIALNELVHEHNEFCRIINNVIIESYKQQENIK